MTIRPVETELRVRYAETDRMGVVHHSVHLVWFETGRTEYCRAAGFSYAELEKTRRIFLVVAEVRCRYRAPATYDDRVFLTTRVTEVSNRRVRFEYELRHADGGRVIATAETTHIPVNSEGRPTTLPPVYVDQLRSFAGVDVPAGG